MWFVHFLYHCFSHFLLLLHSTCFRKAVYAHNTSHYFFRHVHPRYLSHTILRRLFVQTILHTFLSWHYSTCYSQEESNPSVFMFVVLVYFQRGSEELMSHSPMVTTNGTGHSPSQNEVNDAKKVNKQLKLLFSWFIVWSFPGCIILQTELGVCSGGTGWWEGGHQGAGCIIMNSMCQVRVNNIWSIISNTWN